MSMNAGVSSEIPATECGLIRAHGMAALAMVLYSALLGLAVGLKFHWPEFLGATSWLTWGRLRYGHTQGIFFGWLGNAFLAWLYFAVPRLAGRPVTSRALGWLLFVVWNLGVVIPGWVLVQNGVSQPLEWAEFPIVTDVFVVAAFLLYGNVVNAQELAELSYRRHRRHSRRTSRRIVESNSSSPRAGSSSPRCA